MIPKTQRVGRGGGGSYCGICGTRHGGVPEEDEPGKTGDRLGEQLNLLGDDVFVLGGEPGDVPAWAREACHQTGGDRVAQDGGDDDGGAARRSPGRPDRGSPGDDNDIALGLDELGRQRGQALAPAVRPAVLHRDRLALDPAQLPEPLPEGTERLGRTRRVRVSEEPDARQELPRLLRVGGERRGEEAAS